MEKIREQIWVEANEGKKCENIYSYFGAYYESVTLYALYINYIELNYCSTNMEMSARIQHQYFIII